MRDVKSDAAGNDAEWNVLANSGMVKIGRSGEGIYALIHEWSVGWSRDYTILFLSS